MGEKCLWTKIHKGSKWLEDGTRGKRYREGINPAKGGKALTGEIFLGANHATKRKNICESRGKSDSLGKKTTKYGRRFKEGSLVL